MLTPSVLRDSPSEVYLIIWYGFWIRLLIQDLSEDQAQILNIINNRNDAAIMRKEVQKMILKFPKSATKLNEIKEIDDNLV